MASSKALVMTSSVQYSRSVVTAIGTSSTDHQDLIFLNRSLLLRSSFLPLRRIASGVNVVRRQLPNEVARRDYASGLDVVRSGLMERLTGEREPRVKECVEFYIHEIRSGDPNDKSATLKLVNLPPNSTAVPVQWGSSFVFDNEVRAGLGADSTLLGRERGWGVFADRTCEAGMQLTSKVSFTEGKYKGSTLTFCGNIGGPTPYELIVNGGTGHFRGARGYVLAGNAPNDGPRFRFHWKVFIL